MSSESGVRMTYKEIKTVFRKITTTKIVVLFFELILVYSLFLKEIQLTLLVLSALEILMNTIFINLWEGINEERLNDYDR